MTKKEIEKFLKKTNAKKTKDGYLLTMESSICLDKELLKDASKKELEDLLSDIFNSVTTKDEIIKNLFN